MKRGTLKDGKPIRITVDLSPAFYDRLERIEGLTGAASKAEVVREALQLYEYLVTRTVAGAEFQVIEKNKERKTLVIFTCLEER